MASISASVGRGGVNRRPDVLTVQGLINNKLPIPLTPLKVDGICGNQTIFAITEFQRREVGMRQPDGRVDPGGATLSKLNGGGGGGGRTAPFPPAPTPPVPPPPAPPPAPSPSNVTTSVAKPADMRESAWQYLLKFTKKHEAEVLHMYNNRTAASTKQDVTCGIGVLIDPRAAALSPGIRSMFYDPATMAAPTDAQMLADWDAAAALSRTGTNLNQYGVVCKMRCFRDKVTDTMANILKQKLQSLKTHPGCEGDFADFANFPAAAQCFSVSFAYGRIPIDFKLMRAAIRVKDWKGASAQCRLVGASALKNEAHRKLLLFAQDIVDQSRGFDEMPGTIL